MARKKSDDIQDETRYKLNEALPGITHEKPRITYDLGENEDNIEILKSGLMLTTTHTNKI